MSDWHAYNELRGADNTVTGTVVIWPGLASPQLGGSRDILAYLPPSLSDHRDGSRRYPVIYFQDGQNVFDERTSYTGEWRADETLEQLAGEGLEAIAVAIPNGGSARMDEYNPWRGPNQFAGGRISGGKGDAYLDWVVDHVKSLVDRTLPSAPGRSTTGIVGSSLGGLISLYALAAHPHVFGLAALMSPSLAWSDHQVLELVRAGRIPPTRIHLDAGGREWQGMFAEARRLRDLLLEQGFVEGRDLQYVEDRSGIHRESAWARRLPDALRFLLAETRAK